MDRDKENQTRMTKLKGFLRWLAWALLFVLAYGVAVAFVALLAVTWKSASRPVKTTADFTGQVQVVWSAVAVIFALVAIAIASAALYLASLRRAEIVMWELPGSRIGGGWSGDFEMTTDLRVATTVSNLGARGGVLLEVDLEVGAPFTNARPTRLLNNAAFEQLPMALPSGETKTLQLERVATYADRGSLDALERLRDNLVSNKNIVCKLRWKAMAPRVASKHGGERQGRTSFKIETAPLIDAINGRLQEIDQRAKERRQDS